MSCTKINEGIVVLCGVLYCGPFFLFSFGCKWEWMHSGDVFRNMSVSILVDFRIKSGSKIFICPLFFYVVLNFMSLCFWFIIVVIRSGYVLLESYTYNQNAIYITGVERYVFGVEIMFYMFIFEVFKNISAVVFEMGRTMVTSFCGWFILFRNVK